jgi:hypothetical protein
MKKEMYIATLRTDDELHADGRGIGVKCLCVQGRQRLDEALLLKSIYSFAGVECVDWHSGEISPDGKRQEREERSTLGNGVVIR